MEVFPDPIAAMEGALEASAGAAHDMAGFRRRLERDRYRFAARCRACLWEVTVDRVASGWSFDRIVPCAETAPVE